MARKATEDRAARAGRHFDAVPACHRASHAAGTMWNDICWHDLANFEAKIERRVRAQCAAIADQVALRNLDSYRKAVGAGRELVATCRASDAETAKEIARAIDARATTPRRRKRA